MLNSIKIAFLLALVALLGLAIFPGSVLAYDLRTVKVARYLASFDSPLTQYAPIFVEEADKNGFDYRLLVAIAGVESTFGKHYIEGTYNVWGWGVGKIPFASFEEAIKRISSQLRKNYIERGADEIDEIARIYCPPTFESWSAKVKHFMTKIDETEISDVRINNIVGSATSLPQFTL